MKDDELSETTTVGPRHTLIDCRHYVALILAQGVDLGHFSICEVTQTKLLAELISSVPEVEQRAERKTYKRPSLCIASSSATVSSNATERSG